MKVMQELLVEISSNVRVALTDGEIKEIIKILNTLDEREYATEVSESLKCALMMNKSPRIYFSDVVVAIKDSLNSYAKSEAKRSKIKGWRGSDYEQDEILRVFYFKKFCKENALEKYL